MIFGVRERNICQDGTRIIPFCLGLVLEGEGYIVYLLCFLVPHLSGGQVSSSSVSGIYVPGNIGSWEIHIGKDLRDNLVQLSCFADEKVQPQMSKGPS